jgi:hypothetical protein
MSALAELQERVVASLTSSTRSVLPPSGMTSPACQFGVALDSVDGSAGAPSANSSLKRKPAIRLLLAGGPNG